MLSAMQPPTGDRKLRDEVIRIAELTVNSNTMQDLEFINCRIIGPAVLLALGTTSLLHCALGGPIESLFWEIPPERTHVIGGVAVVNCIFSNCRFEEIGLGGPRSLYDALVADVNQ